MATTSRLRAYPLNGPSQTVQDAEEKTAHNGFGDLLSSISCTSQMILGMGIVPLKLDRCDVSYDTMIDDNSNVPYDRYNVAVALGSMVTFKRLSPETWEEGRIMPPALVHNAVRKLHEKTTNHTGNVDLPTFRDWVVESLEEPIWDLKSLLTDHSANTDNPEETRLRRLEIEAEWERSLEETAAVRGNESKSALNCFALSVPVGKYKPTASEDEDELNSGRVVIRGACLSRNPIDDLTASMTLMRDPRVSTEDSFVRMKHPQITLIESSIFESGRVEDIGIGFQLVLNYLLARKRKATATASSASG